MSDYPFRRDISSLNATPIYEAIDSQRPSLLSQARAKRIIGVTTLVLMVTAFSFGYTGADPTHDFKTPYRIVVSVEALGLSKTNTTNVYLYPQQMRAVLDNLTAQETKLSTQSLLAQCQQKQQTTPNLGCLFGVALGSVLLKGFGFKAEIQVYQRQWFQWIKIHDFAYPP